MNALRIMHIAVNYLLVYILSLLCFCFCCVELNSFLGGVCLTRSCCAHWPFQRYAWDWVHSYKQSHSAIRRNTDPVSLDLHPIIFQKFSPPFIIFHFEYLAYEKLHGPEPWRGSLHIHFLSFPML